MRTIARAVNDLTPDGYGFFVLCVKGNQREYISNMTRETVIEAMRDFIVRDLLEQHLKKGGALSAVD